MFGTGIAKGMMVTMRHLFRRPFTIQYPEEIRPFPANARTNLVWFEERCTGCSTCAQACPDGLCSLVRSGPAPALPQPAQESGRLVAFDGSCRLGSASAAARSRRRSASARSG